MKVMLAKQFDGQNVKDWLMSEKLDGVRAIWTGSELLSRNGNKLIAPAWFIEQLPSGIILDGELYIGRNKFQQTVSAVRKKDPIKSEWQFIRYCVFDAPECEGGFETRLIFCSGILSSCAIAKVVKHEICRSAAHLKNVFDALVFKGAEGIMLRRPNSKYEQRRSDCLLKYKPIESDEAEIVGYQNGEGKYTGMLGALICNWKGKIVQLGTGITDALRYVPPKIGVKVTFSFHGLTDGGIPRFPVFIGERNYE